MKSRLSSLGFYSPPVLETGTRFQIGSDAPASRASGLAPIPPADLTPPPAALSSPMQPETTNGNHVRLLWMAGLALLTVACVVRADYEGYVGPSPANLSLKLSSLASQYSTMDTFFGTLTFTNLSDNTIFKSNCPCGPTEIGLYDWSDTLRRHCFPDSGHWTAIELGPHERLIDTLRFALSVPPDTLTSALYWCRAWLTGSEDICAETTIFLNRPSERH